MYYESLNYYLHHECANITNQINYFSQNSESGRDQGHASLGLGNMAEISQVAWNQGGKEYFGLVNDQLLVRYEYTAIYNLGYSVTYNLVFYRRGTNFVGGPWQQISNVSRWQWSPVYEISYGHYAQRQGRGMSWVTEHLLKQEFELVNRDNNMGDNPTYGTLRFRQLAGAIR